MPYELRGNCVHKVGDMKPLKCYDNHADALAYLRALEANVPEANKMITLFTQEDVNYTPVSTARGKACSACRFYCDEGCHIVMGEIAPNGYCDRYETVPPPPPPPDVAPIPVMIVEAPEMGMGEMSMKTVDEDGLFFRVWERIQKKYTELRPKPDGVFTVQKDLKGQWRWVATYTNNFMDREGEIISDKALDTYLARVDMGLVPMPELWAAHIPETKHGKADMVFAVGKFLVATGTFDDTPLARKALDYYRKNAAKVQLSHGFTYPKWALKGGVYADINTFEITTLPPPLVASNPYTDLEVNESMKQITPDTQVALAELFGKEETEKLIARRTEQSKALEEAGVAYKDFADVTGAEAAVEAAPAEDKKPDAMATLLQTLMQDMGELLQAQADQGKAFGNFRAAHDAKVKELTDANVALKSELARVQTELRLTPRAASSAQETKLSDAEAAAVKQEMAQVDADPFWKA